MLRGWRDGRKLASGNVRSQIRRLPKVRREKRNMPGRESEFLSVDSRAAGRQGGSRGIQYMVAGAFFFSVMSLGVKLAGSRIPSQEVVLIRGVITLAFTYLLLRRVGVRPKGERRGMLMLRGLFGYGALSCLYYSLVHLPLADATVLQYMNPIITALLAGWLLDERMQRWEVGLVLASFFGVILIARPSFLFGSASSGLDLGAVAIALLGATCSACAYVTVRKLSRTEHPLVIVYYFTLVTVPAAIPGTLANAVWPSSREWLILLGVGLAAQGGQVYLTRGLQLEPAGKATAAAYTQVVFAALWGAIFFGEFPDLWVIAGASIILASTLILARVHARGVPLAPVADEGANLDTANGER